MNSKHYLGKPCVRGHDGLRFAATNHCVYCHKLAAKTSSVKANRKKYYSKTKTKRLEQSRVWKLANPTAKRRYDLKKYGLTYEQYLAMLIAQNNSCAICKNQFVNNKHTHVDHCHDTNIVRGILCNKCNLAIGFLNSSPIVATNAAIYLGDRT